MLGDYYLGLDMGTNSVGWAVTDEEYVLKKYKGNLMWGVNLFDEAKHAADRRMHRTMRRRYGRRRQRLELLRELLFSEIQRVDPHFFDRLKESRLFPEDSKYRTRSIYFDDENYTDKEYFRNYPTIHHLITELMDRDEPHDIRLVYLACAYLLKHRGHFLFEVDADKVEAVRDFSTPYRQFVEWFYTMEIEMPFECEDREFGDILKKKIGITAKEKEMKRLFFGGKTPEQDKDPGYPIHISKLIRLICGETVKLSELFKNEDYKELEQNSICVAAADFDEKFEPICDQLGDGESDLIKAAKGLYDWSLLEDILRGYGSVSEAKKAVYDKHREDLRDLKTVAEALSCEERREIFKTPEKPNNYVAYSRNFRSVKNGIYPKPCSQEEFCKFIKPYLAKIDAGRVDAQKLERLKEEAESGTLCPKQVTDSNRVIPYQLYYYELKKILSQAKKYLPVLNQTDKYGSVADKILSIMSFRVPYYVGPLARCGGKNSHAWIERKAEGKIYPWNFEQVVDLDRSEEAFIKRMTGKCTYLAGEDVLPKNSLLYTKFCVLNEINCISVDGQRISTEMKQKIYHELFLKKRTKVTKKKIKDFFVKEGEMEQEQTLSGVDDSIRSSLKPHIDFHRLISEKHLTENEVESIIERITATTDKTRLKKWLRENFKQLSKEDIDYISKLSYKDYGKLSRAFLEGITNVDLETGEATEDTVISEMWEKSLNLMQLLSGQYGFAKVVEQWNSEFYGKTPRTVATRLEEMHVSTAVRRSIIRTLDIAKEIKHLMGSEPKKIFVEVPREVSDNGKKGKRTKSRKDSVRELLELARDFASSGEVEHLKEQLEQFDEGKLRSDKYYLYFTQLGKCMYSGETIDLSQIENDNVYNIDHIYPRSKVKDDSLSNKVLVKSELNGDKGDRPVKREIIREKRGFWEYLLRKGLITEKKFKRLTRSEEFTEEELTGFINRQLVETSQSAKAAAVILGELFPNSRIVYVKAKNVSDFRDVVLKMRKCREINDLHHAKDAYLNIAVGNVYDVRFTRNPSDIIKRGERYSLKPEVIFSQQAVRGDVVAWQPDRSLETVKRMMAKNSIRYVRYSYKGKGELFNANPEKAKSGLIEIKKGLATEKYGGYNHSSATYFTAVKFGEPSVCLMPVELMFAEKYEKDRDFAKEYCAKVLTDILDQPIEKDSIFFPFGNRILKKNTLLEINGCRYNLISKSNRGRTLGIALAESLIVDEKDYIYIKRIFKFLKESENGKKFPASSSNDMNGEKNAALFSLLCQKCVSKPFEIFLGKIGKKIGSSIEKFEKLNLTEQALLLAQLVFLLKTGRSVGCDLRLIGESKEAGKITINSTLNKMKGLESVYIIDQSPTGLLEKRSPNLLEL